jgi:hypothetical protein
MPVIDAIFSSEFSSICVQMTMLPVRMRTIKYALPQHVLALNVKNDKNTIIDCMQTICIYSRQEMMTAKVTTAAGFEPALPKGNALAGHRLNRSAKLSHFLECRMLQ